MTQTIVRMYGSHDNAMSAVNELKRNRFEDNEIHVVSAEGAHGGEGDGIVEAIMKAYVLKSQAKVYAEGVRRGGTLVVVHAPFGSALEATEILDSHSPIDSGVPDTDHDRLTWDEAAPLSSTFQWPLLSSDSTPFSSFWNLPSLSRGRVFPALNLPETTSPDASLSGAIGMPLLSRSAPLSFGLPLLTKSSAPRR